MRATTVKGRDLFGSILALGSGLVIAVVDSSPGWDDTGITAAALGLAAAVAALIAGRRPWLIALLVGLPTPLLEVPTTGQPVAFVALLISSVGALCGYLVARSVRPAAPAE